MEKIKTELLLKTRMEYTIELHNKDMEILRIELINKLKLNKSVSSKDYIYIENNFNIVKLINNMVNPIPEERYKNIDDVIKQIGEI
jgi:hypothetical protein